MNTHCNTVWSKRHHRALSLHIKFHVFRSGVRTPVKATPCFQVWGPNPSQGNFMFPGLGFEPQSRQLHVSRSGVRIPDKATSCFQVGGSNPRPGNVDQGKRPMIAHCFTQWSNGCSLDSLLIPRQDNHVQRCSFHKRVRKSAAISKTLLT